MHTSLHHGHTLAYLQSRFKISNVIRAFNHTSSREEIPIIQSLNVNELKRSDFLRPSGMPFYKIKSKLKDGRIISGKLRYTRSKIAFPENTQGFLYCHHDPRLPYRTSEIRFRITKDASPKSFEEGIDLPDNRWGGVLPWSIPIAILDYWKHNLPLVELAKDSRMLPDGQVNNIEANNGDFKRKQRRSPNHLITYLEHPFVVDLERHTGFSILDAELQLVPTNINLLFKRFIDLQHVPELKGKMLVRLERASSSDHARIGAIVMRVLKVLEPIEPLLDNPPSFPVEGTLLMVDAPYPQIREFDSIWLQQLPSLTSDGIINNPIDPQTKRDRQINIWFTEDGHQVHTLDPRRLQPSDFIIASNRHVKRVRKRSDQTVLLNPRFGDVFPPNTQGFLYIYRNPLLPPLATQIRFRLSASNRTEEFAQGNDLLTPNGTPWRFDAMNFLQMPTFKSLSEQLKEDGFGDVVDALMELRHNMLDRCLGLGRGRRNRALTFLEQPFIADVSARFHCFTSVSTNGLQMFAIPDIFSDMAPRRKARRCPYTGRVVLRFERSTLPEHLNGNYAVLRVLKVLDPIKPVDPAYDGAIPMPQVGSLILKGGKNVRAFDLNSDLKAHRALRSLPTAPDFEPDITLPHSIDFSRNSQVFGQILRVEDVLGAFSKYIQLLGKDDVDNLSPNDFGCQETLRHMHFEAMDQDLALFALIDFLDELVNARTIFAAEVDDLIPSPFPHNPASMLSLKKLFVSVVLATTTIAQTLSGQYSCATGGSYTLCQNLWGEAQGTGSQTSTLISASGNSVSWSTQWTWANNPNSVKSYANVISNTAKGVQLSNIASAPTTWNWQYQSESTGIRADVSYDIWTGVASAGDPATNASSYEIMIWLSGQGGIQPVGSQVASGISLAGYTWNLWKGPNSNWEVLSFVSASGDITSFSADLGVFFRGCSSDLHTTFEAYRIYQNISFKTRYLQSVQSGTEPFTGSATLLTNSYSVAVNKGTPSSATTSNPVTTSTSTTTTKASTTATTTTTASTGTQTHYGQW
ncbi:hypothetical protein H0H93_014589 [Arthromyces matolae]|nr:hypothetical protein H0H93_014589 [Arthromyces matolae]